MRKYINKGIIIALLILANLFFQMKTEKPNYENTNIKRRFTLASDSNESKLKRPRKINIAKHGDFSAEPSKNDIISKVLTATSSNFIKNYQDYDEDPFNLINQYEDADKNTDDEDNEAIVLETEQENPILGKWSANNASIYYKDEKNLVLSSNNGNNIILRPKSTILANKEYISLNFDGCTDAKLKLIKNGAIEEVNLSGASDFKYFYISDDLRGSSVDSIEFISDNKKSFYLSIGEIKYE